MENSQLTKSDLFALNGKIGRIKYFMGLFACFFFVCLLLLLDSLTGMLHNEIIKIALMIGFLLGSVIFLWMYFAINKKRIQDLGLNGWLALLAFIPGVGQVINVLLLFIPGKK